MGAVEEPDVAAAVYRGRASARRRRLEPTDVINWRPAGDEAFRRRAEAADTLATFHDEDNDGITEWCGFSSDSQPGNMRPVPPEAGGAAS